MAHRILVTGASVAGVTAAWWLGHLENEVIVVERATEFRGGGQNVDIRGVGRDVLRRMGLDKAALAHGTGETGTAWVTSDGRVAAQFITAELGGDGPTAEMEILRGDLARLLFEAAQGLAEFRFGDSITHIDQDGGHPIVTFDSGRVEHFDAVVIAEGVGSSTRELAFPHENDPRWMDLTIAYFTIRKAADDGHLWRWYNATGGRSVSLRPDRHGTTRAMLSIQQPPGGEQGWSSDRQKALLHKRFAGAGWQTDRVLDGMDGTDDFYFDVLRQVRMPQWSTGRVVLTGDAAWCATPLAGIGTTLAVTGAFVLAQELSKAADVETGLAAYEQAMRPMVEQGQGVPKIAPRLANPKSRLGILLLHKALNLASRPMVRKFSGRLFSRPPKAPDMSAYDGPRHFS